MRLSELYSTECRYRSCHTVCCLISHHIASHRIASHRVLPYSYSFIPLHCTIFLHMICTSIRSLDCNTKHCLYTTSTVLLQCFNSEEQRQQQQQQQQCYTSSSESPSRGSRTVIPEVELPTAGVLSAVCMVFSSADSNRDTSA